MNWLDYVPVVGGLVDAITTIGTTGKTNKTNLQIARETNAANRALAEYQAQYNERMWNLQNEYNSPSAQMARFEDAGLNPNLIYGNGSASAGNASSHPTYDRPTMQGATAIPLQRSLGLGDAAASIIAMKRARLENERLENMIDMQGYQASILSSKANQAALKATLDQMTVTQRSQFLAKYPEILQSQVTAAVESINNMRRQGALLDQKLSLNEQENTRRNEAMQISWAKLSLAERANAIQQLLANNTLNLTNKQMDRINFEIANLSAERRIKEVQAQFEEELGKDKSKIAMQLLRLFLVGK